MSLTSHIDNKESKIRIFFDKNFNFKNFIEETNAQIKNYITLSPVDKSNYPWSDVGHMVEYMMLLHIGLQVEDLFPMRFAKTEYEKIYKRIRSDYSNVASCFKDKNKFKILCNDLYRLSKIESVFRTGNYIQNSEIERLQVNENMAICKIWLEFSFKELIYFNRNI